MRKFPVAALFAVLALAGLGLQWSQASALTARKCPTADQNGSSNEASNYQPYDNFDEWIQKIEEEF